MARRPSLRASLILAILLGGCTPDDAGAPAPKPEAGDWRARLRAALFERTAKDGTKWGRERLDPLVTGSTEHLLVGPSHAAALAILDEFVADPVRAASLSTVERALIQRDLWAIHDWAIEPIALPNKALHVGARKALCERLAAAIKAVALTKEEIDALPDSYAQTVATKPPTAWNARTPARAFLPADLVEPEGPWVCLGDGKSVPLTPHHRRLARGHAAFAVLVRLPEGRAATEAWVAKVAEALAPQDGRDMWSFGTPFPEPPPQTIFAAVRRTMLLDRDGAPRVTPIVERIEFRVHGVETAGQPSATSPPPRGTAASEWNLDGRRLIRGDAGPLVAVAESDVDFVHFENGKGGDLFENFDDTRPSSVLASCATCHGGSMGAVAIHSLTHVLGPLGPLPTALRPSSVAREMGLDVEAKRQRPDYARLREAFGK